MASYQETIERMMRQYPNMYSTEQHCLNHLFLVNGNGYWWEGGQLITVELTDEEVFANRAQRRAELLGSVVGPDQELSEKLKESITKFWSMCSELSLYPISKYSAICTIPDNVQDDWLDAAYRAINLVLTATDEEVHGNLEKEVILAREARANLDRRFGKHGEL